MFTFIIWCNQKKNILPHINITSRGKFYQPNELSFYIVLKYIEIFSIYMVCSFKNLYN